MSCYLFFEPFSARGSISPKQGSASPKYPAAGADDTDTPEKDGFTNGNAISFKMWDTSEQEEMDVVVSSFINPANGDVLNPAPTFLVDDTRYVSLLATHNYKPRADAGPNQNINENRPGQLDGSGSYDPDGLALSYSWQDIDNLGLSSTNIVNPSFTAPDVLQDTEYRVALTVNDGARGSEPDTVIITVKKVDLPPNADAGADFNVNETEQGQLDGSGSSDPDGLNLTYSWEIVPADFTPDSPNSANTDFTAPTVTTDKNYLAILTVTNTVPLSDKDTVVVTVINFNQKPDADAGNDQEVDEGVTVNLDGTGSNDPDDAPDALTYQWTSIDGIPLNNPTTANPDFESPWFLADATYRFKLVVFDGDKYSDPDTVVITVKHENLLPTANAGSDFSVDENTQGQLDGSGSTDLDGPLSFSWAAPAGISLSDGTAENPTFTAPEVELDTDYSIILTVTDSKLATDKDTVVVTVKHINKKPNSDAGANQEVDEDVVVTLDGSASSDPDKLDNITYLWIPPSGITLSDNTAPKPNFTSPFILEDWKDYEFELIVNDGELSDTDKVVVRVIHANLPPVADAGNDFEIDENSDGNLDGSQSSDPEGKPLTYSWVDADNLSLDALDVVNPTFTAPEVGQDTDFEVILTVNDGVRNSEKPDTVVVTVKHYNKKPIADAGQNQTVDENVQVQLDGTASYDPDANDVITYLWVAPNGIVLDDASLATPSFTSPWLMKDSSLLFSLVVNDGVLDSEPSYVNITVEHANLQPGANAGTDIQLNENTQGQLDGSGSSDPENAQLSYSWESPNGFTINNPAAMSPTFTAPEVEQDTDFEIVLTVDDGQSTNNTDENTVVVKVIHINKAPVANAGPDQNVPENVQVQLDGTSSYDSDLFDNITYLWTSIDNAVLDNNTSATPGFTTPILLQNSTFRFVLVVNDGLLNSLPDTVFINVNHGPVPPIADAGQDFEVVENSQVQLDGSGSSDPEGEPLTYLWTAPPGISLSNATAVAPTFTAPKVELNTNYEFILVVNDGGLNSAPDAVVVTVKQVNQPPEAIAGNDKTTREQKIVLLNGSASSDPDALDNISFNWTAPAGIVFDDPTSPTPSFMAPNVLQDTQYIIELEVSDDQLASDTDQLTVTVTSNQSPVADAGNAQTVYSSDVVTLHGEASNDPDGDAITYAWTGPAGISLTDPGSANPTFVAPVIDGQAAYIFTLEVADDLGSSDTENVQITVIGNRPPEIVTEATVIVDEGDTVTLDGSGSYDPDGGGVTFLWTVNTSQKDLLSFDDPTSPTPTFIAPEVDKLTLIGLVLAVSDGIETPTFNIKLYVKDKLNNPPTADAGIDFTVNEGVPGNLDGTASSDFDGDPITYLWDSGFLILDDLTSATPGFTAPEVNIDTTVIVTLTVNDGTVNSGPDTVMITIVNINKAPIANAGEDVVVSEGEEFTLDGSASGDPDGDEITFSWNTGNLEITKSNADSISGTAPEVNEDTIVPFVLTVNDGELDSPPDTVWLTILQVNKAPEFVRVPVDTALFGYQYYDTIEVSDPDIMDNVTLTPDILPVWLNFSDLGEGVAIISTDSVPRDIFLEGSHLVKIVASDGIAVTDTSFNIVVDVKTKISELWLNKLKIYPNPTSGLVHIEFNNLPGPGTIIQVFNQLGQTVLIKQVKSPITEINLSNNRKGLYYVRITANRSFRTEKVILR